MRVLYQEKIDNNPEIMRLLEELSELDELIHGDDETLEFEDTDEGWQTLDVVPAMAS